MARMIGSCAFAADAGSKATKARTVSRNFLMFNSATKVRVVGLSVRGVARVAGMSRCRAGSGDVAVSRG